MAANSSRGRRSTRFSLLLLQHSEVLLTDFAVNYHFIPDASVGSTLHPLDSFPQRFVTRSANATVRGRVKLATHSIFFDCEDWRDPILRIPLESIEYARPARDNSRSRDSGESDSHIHNHSTRRPLAPYHSRLPHQGGGDELDTSDNEDNSDNSVLVIANSVVFQRELGVDHPYVDVRVRGRHIFTPLYSSSLILLDEVMTLLRITTISSMRMRRARMRELVQQREVRVPFDITLLEHGAAEQTLMDAAVSSVHTVARQPGRLRITAHNIYFMPIHGESTASADRIPVTSICGIRSLRHGCRDAALELTFTSSTATSISNNNTLSSISTSSAVGSQGNSKKSLMFSFSSRSVRTRSLEVLNNVLSHDNLETFSRHEQELTLTRWRNGAISNFDYLLYLNLAAGRSFNDLSQYPVFPWVIQDYSSLHLDLDNPSTFRNLYKPIGTLNEKRFETFKERYDELVLSNNNSSTSSTSNYTSSPAFFYGTHYSTPAYVINYVVRAAPAAMLRLQNGRFDTPDRLFHDVASTWHSVLNNPGDVKELIPEFYTLHYGSGEASGMLPSTAIAGEFLDNVLGLELGIRQDGVRVDDVELPPWANNSSQLFVRLMRDALESDYVSKHLHGWIDLIFGVKSRSAEAGNIFFTDVALPPSIEDVGGGESNYGDGSVIVEDDEEMDRIETVYLEFGRTPQQLFQHPHPPRFGETHVVLEPQQSEFNNTMSSNIAGTVTNDGETGDENVSSEHGTLSLDDSETEEWVDAVTSVCERDVQSNVSPSHGGNDMIVMESEFEKQVSNSNSTGGIVKKWSRSKLGHQRELPSPSVSTRGILARVKGGVMTREDDDETPVTQIPSSVLTFVIQTQTGNEDQLQAPSTSMSTSSRIQILDMCLLIDDDDNKTTSRTENTIVDQDVKNKNQQQEKEKEVDLCTVWNNNYLKIHSTNKKATLRSKFIHGINCVTHIGDDVIAYGTRNGSIGLYHMHSARDETIAQSAHEGDIRALILINKVILISASMDGSVKVWKLEKDNGRLRFMLEVDAESCVEDVCAIVDHDDEANEHSNKHKNNIETQSSFSSSNREKTNNNNMINEQRQQTLSSSFASSNVILLAVSTSDTSVLVWKLDLLHTQPFPEPIWRKHDIRINPTTTIMKPNQRRRYHLMTWLRQVHGKKPVLLCSTSDQENANSQTTQTLNVWNIDDEHMASAQVYLGDTVCGVNASHSTHTVIVAGTHGNMAEFDNTGLCIHRIQITPTPSSSSSSEKEPVAICQLVTCPSTGLLVVWDDRDDVYTLHAHNSS